MTWFRTVLAAGALLSVQVAIVQGNDEDQGFVSIFNKSGEPKGWLVREWNDLGKPASGDAKWTVTDGVLRSGSRRGTWLVSEKEYENFVLEFEIKLEALGNSGVALRAPLRGDPAFDGMEFQVADLRYNPKFTLLERAGSIYRSLAPKKDAFRSLDWNKCRITLQGPQLRAIMNGVMILDTNLDEQRMTSKRHDGTTASALRDRPRKGHIGFQHLSRDSSPVQIRHARIKELD